MTKKINSTEEIDTKKVATLDMGGTLVTGNYLDSTHAEYNKALGMTSKEELEIYKKHKAGNGDLENHRAHALDQTKKIQDYEPCLEDYAITTQIIFEDRTTLPGADMFIEDLHSLGYETVVLSSAPPIISVPYAEELNIDNVYVWKDIQFNEEGEFQSVWVNPEGIRGKSEVVEKFKDQGSFIAHFGNGANDKEAVKEAHIGKKQWWEANPEKAFEHARKEASKL